MAEKKTWQVNGLVYTMSGLVVLFILMLTGDFAWAFKDRSVGMITKLLFKQHGASDFLNGVFIVSAPAILGIVISPIVCYRSDRHRGRWGRRVPYLLVTTPIAVAALIGLAFSPMLGRALSVVGIDADKAILIFLAIFWILYEFAMIVAGCVFNAFANDVIPQEMLGRFFGFFRIISLGAGFIFSYWLLGWCGTHSLWLYLGVAVLYGGGMMLLCLRVKEGTYPPPPPVEKKHSRWAVLDGVKTYCKECFSNPYYLLVFTTFLIFPLGFTPYSTYCVFYAAKLGLTLHDYGHFMAYSFIISAVLAFPIGLLADRWHPLRVCIGAILLNFLIALLCGLFITGPNMEWAARHVINLMNFCGMSVSYDAHEVQRIAFGMAEISYSVSCGLYSTASASLAMRLLPSERFAQMGSAASLMAVLVNIVIAPLTGLVLDLTGQNYLYLFWMDAALHFIGVIVGILLYRAFKKHGGPDHYVPPAV